MLIEILNSVTFTWYVETFIFWYGIVIMSSYVLLAFFSILAILTHLRDIKSINYEQILKSSIAPKVSVIAPAYNESASIVDNIRSLLSIRYNNFDIIIVNDGSTDDSLQKMIDTYSLVPSETIKYSNIAHQEVKNIYKSSNPAYHNLLVIDKENGGKADSLNAGINYSDATYIANIDVDCIIEEDALLRMVEPFLQEVDTKIIATGGTIRIANNCEVRHGRITKVRLADKWLPTFQTLEYIRAFLLGRMAWSKLNGLLIISGAFGLFDKKIVVDCGGYNHETVGEDMELVVRMRRYMTDKKQKYRVHYIPEPLCWTESPETIKVFSRQRNRWTRGNAETLLAHKKLFFNPKYGVLGVASYPFWLFFEWFAPIIEFTGIIYFLVLTYMGWVNWEYFLLLLLMVYTFAVALSWFSLLMEEITFRQYKGTKSLLKLLFAAMLEPLVYHPIGTWAAIRGNWDKFILRKSVWGKQVRTGFKHQSTTKK